MDCKVFAFDGPDMQMDTSYIHMDICLGYTTFLDLLHPIVLGNTFYATQLIDDSFLPLLRVLDFARQQRYQ